MGAILATMAATVQAGRASEVRRSERVLPAGGGRSYGIECEISLGVRKAATTSVSQPTKCSQKASRRRRLGTALRENLKRRRAQAKGRSGVQREGEGRPHDSAGIGANKREH